MQRVKSALAVAFLAAAGFVLSLMGGGTESQARDVSLGAVALPTTDGGVIAPSGSKFPAAVIPCPAGVSEFVLQVPSTSTAVRLGPAGVSGKSGAERGFRVAAGESVNWEVWPAYLSAETTTDAGSLVTVICGMR